MRRKLGPALNRAFGTAPGVARDLDVRVVMSPAIELVNALFSRVQVPACVQPVTATAHENLGGPAGADCPLAVDFRLGCEPTVEHHNITENLDFRVKKFEPDKAFAVGGKSRSAFQRYRPRIPLLLAPAISHFFLVPSLVGSCLGGLQLIPRELSIEMGLLNMSPATACTFLLFLAAPPELS
jgi:hypothetical protein